jgi:hypothetical protein
MYTKLLYYVTICHETCITLNGEIMTTVSTQCGTRAVSTVFSKCGKCRQQVKKILD